MASIEAFKNLPDISFIENKTPEETLEEMKADYIAKYKEVTGETITLRPADKDTLKISAMSVQVHQALQYIDRAGKSNFLKYSYGDDLENLAAFKGVERAAQSAATTTVRFTLSATRAATAAIPKGTRVTGPDKIYFATTKYAEIPAGSLTVETPATCTITGTIGNDIRVGTLTTLVDPVPYVASVSNLTVTQGGADVEDDDSLTERAYVAQDGFSTAGPEGAYEYWTKTYNSAITDVKVLNPAAGVVKILFLLEGGALPEDAIMEGLVPYLNAHKVRPCTDEVIVEAPVEMPYNVAFTYYINRSDAGQAANIQTAVATAVEKYTAWQRKIGRDINPDELNSVVKAAGAKRLVIAGPAYAPVPDTSVAALGTSTVTYGGMEDD